MKNLQEIRPFHFDENDCFEDQVVTITNWWNNTQVGVGNLLCYINSWNFKYDCQINDCKNSIGEKFSKSERIEFNASLRKYYGVELSFRYFYTYGELQNSIETELSVGKPVILFLKASYIPWDYAFGKHEIDSAHVFIIVGIDIVNKEFVATDGYYLQKNVRISFENVIDGFTGRCCTMNFYNDYSEFDISNWRLLLNDAIKKLSGYDGTTDFDRIKIFAEDIYNIKSLKFELKEVNGNFTSSELYSAITFLIHGRKKFSRVLSYFYETLEYEFLNDLSTEMSITASKWYKIQHMLVKGSFMPNFERISGRIVDEIKQIAVFEKNIYNHIIGIVGIPEEEFTNSKYACKTHISFSNLEYLDISLFFNNKSFGSISEECNANIITSPIYDKAYFWEKGAPSNEILKVGNLKFKFPMLGDGLYDNISCKGQEIFIDFKGTTNEIMFLGCAVYGNFTEKLSVVFDDGTSQEIEIIFSDWYNKPFFGEKIALKQKVISIKDQGKLEISTKDFYLLGKSYSLNSTAHIMKIILPECPNIHIHAITLGAY